MNRCVLVAPRERGTNSTVHLENSQSSCSDSRRNNRQRIDRMASATIAVGEVQPPRDDVHFSATGNERIDPVLREQALDNRNQLVNVAPFLDLVEQLVMNQLLVAFIGKHDVVLCLGPVLVVLEQAAFARAFRANEQTLL